MADHVGVHRNQHMSKWGKCWLWGSIWPWSSRSPQINMDINQDTLHLWSKFDPNLNGWWVIPWTWSQLTYIRTHTHTVTYTRRQRQYTKAKMASGKMRHQNNSPSYICMGDMSHWLDECTTTLLCRILMNHASVQITYLLSHACERNFC